MKPVVTVRKGGVDLVQISFKRFDRKVDDLLRRASKALEEGYEIVVSFR